MADGPLDDARIDHFLRRGHVVLHGCFGRDAARVLVDDAWARLGYDPENPDTWEKPLAFLYPSQTHRLADFAPTAYAAVCQLVGGAERLGNPDCSVGQWVINLWRGRDEPYTPPGPDVAGWHKDGNFFRHFLDSPEQGLLVVPLFSDVGPRGGGTVLACDSVGVVARLLASRPDGILPAEFDFPPLVRACTDFAELQGRVGDIALIHPFLLHSFAQNHSGRPRFITNLCIALNAPMDFARPDPSPVERAALRGLGVDRLAFAPTAPRERVTP